MSKSLKALEALSIGLAGWGVVYAWANISSRLPKPLSSVVTQTALNTAQSNQPVQIVRVLPPAPVEQQHYVAEGQPAPEPVAYLMPVPDVQYSQATPGYDTDSMNILANGAEYKKIKGKNDFYRNYLKVTAKVLSRLYDSDAVMAEVNPDAPGWDSLSDDEKRDMADLTVNGFHEAGGEGLEGMCAVSESVRLRARDNHQKRGTSIRWQMASLAQYSWMGDPQAVKRLTTRTEANKASWATSYKASAYVRLGQSRAIELGIISPHEAGLCQATLAKIPDGKDYYNPKKVNPAWAKQKLAKTHTAVTIGNHRFLVRRSLLVQRGR